MYNINISILILEGSSAIKTIRMMNHRLIRKDQDMEDIKTSC